MGKKLEEENVEKTNQRTEKGKLVDILDDSMVKHFNGLKMFKQIKIVNYV